MTDYFTRKGLESPRLCGELLLAGVIGCERMRLYMEVDRPATPPELQSLRELVERAGRSEPIAYLLGEQWFFGMRFKVTPDTLIPRPSTEAVVEHVLQSSRAAAGGETVAPTIVDIGTGSGAIAVALAKGIREASVIATDVSAAALEVARANAAAHGVAERIELLEGSLYEPLERRGLMGKIDYLLSNPPYISDAEWVDVASNIRNYEPVTALRAGGDGLEILRPLIARAHEALRPGGQFAFEIAASQKQAALELGRANEALTALRVLLDHEGLPRVLVGERC